MNFWNRILFGNPFSDWAIAIGIIEVSFALIKILRGPVPKKLKNGLMKLKLLLMILLSWQFKSQ